jgi:regulator of nucleoside diphosphate kinase
MNDVMLKSSTMVTAADYERLSELVAVTRLSMPELSSHLEQELEQAKIVPHADPACVQMGSSVRFHDHGSDKIHDIRLVYPADASMMKGWLSVLTPVGSALLGRRAGSSALCCNIAGKVRPLTVMSVQPPDAVTQDAGSVMTG